MKNVGDETSLKAADYKWRIDGYQHVLGNFQLGVDDTDHIAFFCPECSKALRVIDVCTCKTSGDRCTYVILVCDECKILGQRKFYWATESGRFCIKRTDGGVT